MIISSRLVAAAQILLSVVFCAGYFIVLGLFISGEVRTPVAWEDTLKALLSVITAGVLQIVGYWFARQRDSGAAPPPE